MSPSVYVYTSMWVCVCTYVCVRCVCLLLVRACVHMRMLAGENARGRVCEHFCVRVCMLIDRVVESSTPG